MGARLLLVYSVPLIKAIIYSILHLVASVMLSKATDIVNMRAGRDKEEEGTRARYKIMYICWRRITDKVYSIDLCYFTKGPGELRHRTKSSRRT